VEESCNTTVLLPTTSIWHQFRTTSAPANLIPVGEGADAFAAMLRKDLERWGNVARTAGVKAE
jgi:hypothetical protein